MSEHDEDEPVNETPGIVKDVYDAVLIFLQSYGWFIVLAGIVVLYFRENIRRSLSRWSARQQDTDHHRYDSDAVLRRQEAIEESRRRMQEKFDAQAALHAEKMKQKEEEKRKLKLEEWDRHVEGRGYRSKYRPQDEESSASTTTKKKSTVRPADYNPLTGDAGGASYRPDRRGGSFGGRGGG